MHAGSCGLCPQVCVVPSARCGINIYIYSVLTTHGRHRPADVLVPPSHTKGGVFWALDVSVVDPSLPSYVSGCRSNRVPLAAASDKYKAELRTHTTATEQAAAQGTVLPFLKYPLVFESTGAYGQHTLKWFNGMVAHWKSLKQSSSSLALRASARTWLRPTVLIASVRGCLAAAFLLHSCHLLSICRCHRAGPESQPGPERQMSLFSSWRMATAVGQTKVSQAHGPSRP